MKEKIEKLIFIIIIIIISLIMIYWINQKQGFHEDEIFSAISTKLSTGKTVFQESWRSQKLLG